MSTIVLRQTKGSALTFAEGDANFSNLNTDKLEDITGESIGDLSNVDLTGITNGQALVWDNANSKFIAGDAGGASALDDLSDVSITSPTSGQILQYGPTGWMNYSASFNLVQDTNPMLGGTLNGDGNDVRNVVLEDYSETVHSLGSTDSPSIYISNGNVQTVTISSGLSLPAFQDAAAGQSVTLIVTGSGTATGTAAYKFAGGSTTLTSYSVVSVFYDGTTYWCSIATDFQ